MSYIRMSTIKLIIALLVLGAVGYGVYEYAKTHPAPQTGSEGDFTPSVSFACKDNTHFIAEFPNAMTSLDVIVDGVTARTLPRATDVPPTYENADYKYVFAGEEATVTTKASGASTTCSQPQDPNNAPFNFGDAGEGGGAMMDGGTKPDTVLVVSESIQGKWQSTDDSKFVREFKADGTVADSYSGKVDGTGTWKVFTKEKPLDVPFPIEAGASYVQLAMSGSGGYFLDFKITKLTPDTLQLIYLERGGVLNFKKI